MTDRADRSLLVVAVTPGSAGSPRQHRLALSIWFAVGLCSVLGGFGLLTHGSAIYGTLAFAVGLATTTGRDYWTIEWVVLTEAVRIHGLAAGVDHNRKILSQRILAARLPDEFARLELLRALADVAFVRLPGRLFDDLIRVHLGRRYTIASDRSGSFDRRFGNLIRILGNVVVETPVAAGSADRDVDRL